MTQRWRTPVLSLLSLGLVPLVAMSPSAPAAGAVASLDVRWGTPDLLVGQATSVVVGLGGQPAPGEQLVVDVAGVELRGIPAGCRSSGTTARRSWVSADGSRLVCQLTPAATEVVVLGTVEGPVAKGVANVGGVADTLPERPVTTGRGLDQRLLRLVSSPDFLNADIGDLSRGPNHWNRRRSGNATNAHYERALATVLDDWASLDPDQVLVAGDLVDGHWDQDDRHTGTFGPVRHDQQRRDAIRRAAQTFYPQWLERFTSRGLDVAPALGDHEIGDNPWRRPERRLVRTYKSQFARAFTRSGGVPRWADRPSGRASGTAYAWRPVPQVQLVTLDVLDVTPARSRIGLDRAQERWLEGVLARAQADGVTWTIVQGHTPVLEPVRARGSSQLRVPHRERSRLWQLFERYGVDLYLAGEVHDVTLAQSGGVTQLTHGGMFQYGLVNYALLDVHADHLDLDLRDFDTVVKRHGRRLWETRAPGNPRYVEVAPDPFTIGTVTLTPAGGLLDRTGALLPYSR